MAKRYRPGKWASKNSWKACWSPESMRCTRSRSDWWVSNTDGFIVLAVGGGASGGILRRRREMRPGSRVVHPARPVAQPGAGGVEAHLHRAPAPVVPQVARIVAEHVLPPHLVEEGG